MLGTSWLQSEEFIVFSTRNLALTLNKSVSSTSRFLRLCEKKGLIEKVTRGIWANTKHPYFTPTAVVPTLLGSSQGYVSFLTALHRKGIISQIPNSIQIATTGSPRLLRSKIGTFEFFQIKPEMMQQGIDWSETRCPYRIASSEKALLDILYLSTRKGRRFISLPEIEFPRTFKRKRFLQLINQQIKDPRIKAAVMQKVKKGFRPFR